MSTISCNITDGKGRPACPGETPGAFDTLFLFNREEVDSFDLSVNGETITAINFDAGKGLYQVVAKKGSVVARDEKQDDGNGGNNFTHEIDFKDVDLSPEARNFAKSLAGPSLGAIVHTKGGKFIVGGFNDGMFLAVNKMSTVAADLGEFYTLRETEVDEPLRRMLVGNEDDTLAALLAQVVGS